MISLICGIFTVISAMTGHWIAAVICGALTLAFMSASSDERARYRAQVNRDRYWAYGEEPDWKRRKRAEQARRNKQGGTIGE